MAEKACIMVEKQSKYEGTLPAREISWHLKDIRTLNEVIDRLIAGGYVIDNDIRQFCQDGTIRVYVDFNTDKHTFKVSVYSYKLRKKHLTNIAKRIAKAFLKYEEDMYQKRLFDTSWQELKCKFNLQLRFLKGELLDSCAQVIEEIYIYWHNVPDYIKKITNVIGLNVKVHRENRVVEITTYIKDIERAYDYDCDMENLLNYVAYHIAIAIQKWELTVCHCRNLLKNV